MGRVTSSLSGLSEEQLQRIDLLAHRLLEQTAAKAVIVSLADGSAIAAAGDASDAESSQSFTERIGGRLRVVVRYGQATSLGLVRVRMRQFASEMLGIIHRPG